MSNSVLSRLASTLTERREASAEAFNELIIQIADGEEPLTSEVESILTSAQKTPAELGAAVESLLRRRELATKLRVGEALEIERAALVSKKTALIAALEEAKERYSRESAPIDGRVEQIGQTLTELKAAKRELCQTVPIELHEQLKALSLELEKLAAARIGHAANHRRELEIISDRKALLQKKLDSVHAAEYQREIDRATERAAEQLEAQRELDRQAAEIEGEQATIRAANADPVNKTGAPCNATAKRPLMQKSPAPYPRREARR